MNRKQEIFIKTLVEDVRHNATAAAITAGYSKRSAAVTACRLLKNPEVKAAYDAAMDEFHRQNTAAAEEVIEFLTRTMRGEEVDNIPLGVGKGYEELTVGAPSAKDRIKAAELLGRYYNIFDKNDNTDAAESGVVVLAEVAEDE